jgi:hypothetical protein
MGKKNFDEEMKKITIQARELVEDDNDNSIIIIATEKQGDDLKTRISVYGEEGSLSYGIYEFAIHENTNKLFSNGLALVIEETNQKIKKRHSN